MPAAPDAEEQFGPYTVYERLGVGGMATVHRAVEHGQDGRERTVALKRLLAHLADDASFIKSFVREAKLASLLNHPNIVQIYELGRVGTQYFISMEHIDGRDVRRVLRHARRVTGPPPIYVTVGLMLQLCDALDYAHHKTDEDGHPLGLVHRDISPSNLLLTGQGQLKVIDFGIAKAQSSQLHTQTGRVKGKLAYMSPEAISGSRDLDARSDIWATGVILHELCTARPLFASKNEYETLLKVQKGDLVPPSTFNQAVPPELDAIVARALARDANDRYASAAELREALLALRRKYALQTSERDIAGWLTWAFGVEPPEGFSADTSGVMDTSRVHHNKTPRPPRDDEEEAAVEVVWGASARESEDGPVVLEDVPDVSEKHRRPKRDTDDDKFDDIPTPPPSHGTMPSIYGKPDRSAGHSAAVLPGIPRRHPTTGVQAIVPMPAGTDRRRRSGQQDATMPDLDQATVLEAAQSDAGATVPAIPSQRTSDRMRTVRASERMPAVVPRKRADSAASTMTQGRAFTASEPEGPTDALGSRALTDAPTPIPTSSALDEHELFGDDASRAGDSIDGMNTVALITDRNPLSDEALTKPEIRPAGAGAGVPVVRFSKSMPPVNTTNTPISQRLEIVRPVSTRPGVTPAPAFTAPRSGPTRPPSQITATPSGPVAIIAPKSKPVWPYIVGGVVLAGGVATAVVLALASGKMADKPVANPAPPAAAAPVPMTGTIKFVLTPEDAEVRIDGTAVHTGSPWETALATGVHQIEIRKPAHKSWVTSIEVGANETQWMRVVLEPITEAVVDTATLKIATTPAGLDVEIDGKPSDKKTPLETTLAPGPHKIVVRQNGVDVWTQSLVAEAQSDYEFNPSLKRPVAPRPAVVHTPDAGVPVDAAPSPDAAELEKP